MAISDIKLRTKTFTEEELEEQLFFREGVHEVMIGMAEFNETAAGDIYLHVAVAGKSGEESSARLYFTDKSTKYSIDTIRKILIHNAESDEKKAEIREYFNTKVKCLLDLKPLARSLIGKQAWLKIEKSDRTYVGEGGKTRNSYDRDLYGFEPRMKNREAMEPETPQSAAPASVAASTAPQPAPGMAGKTVAPSQISDGDIARQAEKMIDSGKEVDLSDVPF